MRRSNLIFRAVAAVVLGAGSVWMGPGPIAYAEYSQAVRALPSVEVSGHLDSATGEVIVVLKNTKTAALEAWKLTLTYSTPASPTSEFSQTDDNFAALAFPIQRPGVGPIAPMETRELRIQVPAIRSLKSVALDAALFGDLSSEGNATTREEILRAREGQAGALEKWIPVLEEASAKDIDGARQIIRSKLAELADAPEGSATATVRDTVSRLLVPQDPRPAMAQMKSAFERLRQLALRHRNR